ncbi:DUF3859 domain-containing protein [Ketogulonicigenium vulgare]|uniref:Phosphoenolpyruvate carboxykinase n=1 Tax=Ketogulonicigenium vulgare (strain WSH-001) TaxID=759362 RepID=F9Y8C1_KETVW|nr:DUF3859 domain-containing protein [Ketogulonicigenium vulgare]ADO41408.1 phosphoenolpyruvate carboxykinase [Ketogulonicigenium vulgare Y25]AEM42407.1 Phosphoenolpyruvate carboxykinase [Ketogulonicigenium vulgare WSH-001]ALJ82210.1 phosphoenolpyruvate carboxykinase [Ketogulonicigenium vulgare]ANW32910.1 phosphoenolpyruvate carboxykinase [Ketogulonicigenium vulgare]AOZ53492.1 phosphoenolpyruvate carboxykinase [Ketogulonicigenium vulgare]
MRIAAQLLTGLALAAGLAAPAMAQSQRNTAGVDIGAVCPSGFTSTATAATVPVLAWTDHVPASPGFGFATRANVNVPAGSGDLVLTLTRPTLDGGTTQEQFRQQINGQGVSAFAYTFATPDETVAGTWRLVAEAGGAQIYTAEVTVYTPGANDSLIASCS